MVGRYGFDGLLDRMASFSDVAMTSCNASSPKESIALAESLNSNDIERQVERPSDGQ